MKIQESFGRQDEGRVRIEIMGLGFDALTEDQVINHVLDSMDSGRGGWMLTANIDMLRQIVSSAELRELTGTADLVVADGMPIVWASRLQGTPLPGRVAGASLMQSVSAAAAGRGIPVFVLGGGEGTAERAVARLQADTPVLLAGYHVPPFGFESDSSDRQAIDEAVAVFGDAIYFCGLGFPRQERLIADLAPRFPGSWFIGSGGSADFLAGRTRRAPHWMQRAGLEWLHRLKEEPRRLWRRYVIEDIPFAARMGLHTLLEAVRRAFR